MNKNNPHPSRIAQKQRTVAQMIRLYCRKERGQQGAPAMPRAAGICTHAPVPLSVRRKEEHLQTLHHSLLQARNERTDA